MATTSQSPIIVQAGSKSMLEKAIGWLIGGAVVIGGGFFARKMYVDWRKQQAAGKVGDSPEHQVASKLGNGFNPSGNEWMKSIDTTDEGAIFSAAREISERGLDWKKVVKAYLELHNRNLESDLRSELDGEEYKKFFDLVNMAKKSVAYQVKPGHVIISTKEVNIRKTPKWTGKKKLTTAELLVPAIKIFDDESQSGSNIIALVESGRILGVPTGRIVYDEKPKGGVLFLEIKILDSKDGKKSYNVWVAASQVKTTPWSEVKGKGIPVIKLKQSAYESAKSILGSTGQEADFNYELITTGTAEILDQEMKFVMNVPENIIVGYPIRTFSYENEEYVEFLTIDETVRVTKTENITSVEHA